MKKLLSVFLAVFAFASLTFSQESIHSVGPAPFNNVGQIYTGEQMDAIGTRAFTQISSSPTFQFGKSFMESCTITNIGSPFTITFPGGLVMRNGVVYTWNQSSPFQLWSIDTVTGTHTLVFNMTGVPQANFTGMTWDGTTMYGVSTSITASQIFSVNMSTGVCTPIGTAQALCAGAIELLGRPGAQYSLFAPDIVADNLYKFNKLTGVAALVGPLGQNINFGQGGSADPNDNTFYMMAYTTGPELRKLDTATGSLGPVLCTYLAQATGLACVSSVAAPVVCTYTWGPQVSGTTAGFFSVKAVSNLVAWSAAATAVVRRTTDGGITWGNGNPNPGVIVGDIYNIEALDANTAWVTTSGASTFIYKTTNGGTNWVQVYTLAGGFINAIKMTSATNGYAFGDPVGGNWLLLTTVNGGTTWTTLSSPPGTGDGRNNCVQVSLPNIWFGTGQGTVVRSTNSGINWVTTPVTGITGQILGIKFNSPALGLLGGATLSRTTDGGATWAAVTAPGTGNITGIDGLGNDFWYVRGTGIYRSTDGGLTFASVHTAVGTQNDLKLTNDPNGCLVGWSVATAGNIAKMTGSPLGIVTSNNEIPSNFSLEQNYPNPFNPTTNIRFSIPNTGFVRLIVFDILGREAATLVNEVRSAGNYTVDFDASLLSSGVYFYRLESGSFTESKKMLLVK